TLARLNMGVLLVGIPVVPRHSAISATLPTTAPSFARMRTPTVMLRGDTVVFLVTHPSSTNPPPPRNDWREVSVGWGVAVPAPATNPMTPILATFWNQ